MKPNLTTAALATAILTSRLLFAAPKYEEMDYGRFLSASFDNVEGKNTLNGKGTTCNKGIAVKLGGGEAAMVFDTDLCRMAGGWTGGWVRLKGVAFDGAHGPNPGPAKGAEIHFQTNPSPTWSKGTDFNDPRPLPKGPGAAKVPFGPLPKDWARYKGLFVHGDNVVFSYSVGTAGLLEMPSLEKVNDHSVLTRTFNVTHGGAASSTIVFETEGAKPEIKDGVAFVNSDPKNPDARVAISVAGIPGAKLVADGDRVILQLPAFVPGQAFKVSYARGTAGDAEKLAAAAKGVSKPENLAQFTKGGPAKWPQTVEAEGKQGTDDGKSPYVVDTIGLPNENPWKSWIRPGGFDFFKDGRMAFCTWSGDVWIGSAPDEKLEKTKWRRYAAGLHQALGLKIVDDQMYVLGRDQITRLHDLNNDGEADAYENFNNDVQVTPGFHEFTFDLQTDPQGNFYFAKGGPVNPGGRGWGPLSDHNGCIFKVSKDGSKFEVYATGVRAPNGIGVGPNGEVTTGDNEGTWVPKCYIHLVKPGSFITVADLAHRDPVPTDYERHICFLPKDWDNSGGGQVWVTTDKWGPLKNRLLHLSYGTCTLMGVMMEKVDGVVQGGVFRFPLKFESGIMRGRFSPIDGQLYVVGLKGWQTSASKDGNLQRVRFIPGRTVTYPETLRVTNKGIHIGFTEKIDPGSVDAGNFSVKQWNYKWSSAYGSDDWKVSDPTKKGRDDVEVKSAKLSDDGKTVFLEIDGLAPVMQMEIRMNLKGANGSSVPDRIMNTINAVGKE